ncbi:hypothetical protein [Novosphingobium gossypii]|uniref:hypothetical protein n=1 Tax=Novosphingobium gossypii TaxID=1604774 RepID=UPI003D22BB51
MKTIVPWFAAILGLGAIANGITMLVVPPEWYFAVPGVTTTGPFNQHFIRDIGMTYGFVGGALVMGARAPALRLVLWAAASAWLSAHALFHFWEVAVGICDPSQLVTDFPAVFTPALITVAMTAWAAATGRRGPGAAAVAQPAG